MKKFIYAVLMVSLACTTTSIYSTKSLKGGGNSRALNLDGGGNG